MNGDTRTQYAKGTEAGVPTKADVWKTLDVEFLAFPPVDHGQVPKHILKSIWSFDPSAVPYWIRRSYKTHDGKVAVRVFNGLGYESFLPNSIKEPVNLFRPTGKYKFNGPVYEQDVFEWYPRNLKRRDIPGVYLPWDELRLLELRFAHWRIYGRLNGAELTHRENQAMFESKQAGIDKVVADSRDRLNDYYGMVGNNPYVGYTGREFVGH